jgi:putative DNA primase/helicase
MSIATLSAGNMLAVAKAMRERYPTRPFVFLADLVKATGKPDPHAIEAARAVGGKLAIPDFGSDRDPDMTDFNDMAALVGMDAVREAIRGAKAVSGADHQPEAENPPQSAGAWPDPQAIPCSLLPVEPFDNELLPVALRAWVADIAERMQCPPDFPAVGAMVALSSVIGRKACIKPKRYDDWQVVPNLWGAIVGRPGVLKSPALAEVMRPLDRLQIIASDLHAEAMRDHGIKEKMEGMTGKAAESKAQKLIAKGSKNEAEQVLMDAAEAEGLKPPALRRYKVTDATVESLGEILIENPWGTLAYRDELNGLLRSLDKEGQEGARAFYLQGYDGNQGYTFDRIQRGRYLNIPAVCISMLGGIQPGKIQAYIHDAMSGGAGDDGLLQRFGMFVWPDVVGEWRNVDRWPDTVAKNAAYKAFERLDAIQPGVDAEGQESPIVYKFSNEAQGIFEDWRLEYETDLRSGDHHLAMESHLAKYRKLVPAVALVCALADGEAEVSEDSLLRSVAWSAYLKTHAQRAYAAGARPATEGAKALLAKIVDGKVTDGFKPSDVYLKGWAKLTEVNDVHTAASMLCDLGHLRRIEKAPSEKGGRPSTCYQINPKTLGGN